MNREKIIVLLAMAVVVLMVLFPPWIIRRSVGGFHGPEYAAGYSFIAAPPNKTYSNGGAVIEGATVDLSRLLLQFVALALVTGGTIVALRMPCCQRRTADQGEREAKLRAA